MKLLIIGGVAGGASAAARARRLSETAEIILFERGPDVSFANCGMPYYLGRQIAPRDKLLVVKPSLLQTRYRLDVRIRTAVERIDRAAKCVHAHDLETGRTYTESYDKLILAPGAAPLKPNWPGIELPGVHTLRNLTDMDRIMAGLDKARRAVIIGGGFIGLELAENFIHRGVQTTLIEHNAQLLGPLDPEMAAPLTAVCREHGINVLLETSVVGINKTADELEAVTRDEKRIAADLVILGIGVRPENGLATTAGLPVGPRGGIQVDEFLRTVDPDIYAVGDAVETREFPTLQPTQVPLAGPANRQGRLAADHIFGRATPFRGVQGTAIIGCFERTAGITGINEKILRARKLPYRAVYIHPAHHAGYYPGAEQMTIKLLFSPDDGRILGAQVVGGAGVDKRLDVLAVAIQARMTVYDLEESELAYAPQYGSAKDPINMAGFVAAGLLRNDHPQLSVSEFVDWRAANPQGVILDVRTAEEFARGALPDAKNMPIDELREWIGKLNPTVEYLCYCQVGMRGYLATRILLQQGLRVRNLGGGYKTWELFAATRQ